MGSAARPVALVAVLMVLSIASASSDKEISATEETAADQARRHNTTSRLLHLHLCRDDCYRKVNKLH